MGTTVLHVTNKLNATKALLNMKDTSLPARPHNIWPRLV